MPTGGITSAGTGLRLQTASPGQADGGNTNITGVMIADGFTTAPVGVGASNYPENFGHGNVNESAAINSRNTMFGQTLTTGHNGNCVAFGNQSSAYGQTSVAMGNLCTAGFSGMTTARKVAVGNECTAGNAAGAPSVQVAMGCIVTASGTTNTVGVGANITLRGTLADQPQVAFGSNITAGGNVGNKENAYFGIGINTGATLLQNFLAIGVWDGTGSSGAFPVPASNSILIGNDAQTKVKIGPYDFSNGSAAIQRAVNDANAVAAASDATIAFSAITAARTVALPAANAVPAGFRLLVVDDSGGASVVNTITINRAGADTINGLASAVITTAYGCRELKSDGISKWTIIRSL